MTTLYNAGDALRAERIAVKARRIGKPYVSAKEETSSHKIQCSKIEGTAFCVIEKPLRNVSAISREF
jgi:hypothetical protein